MDPGFGRWSGGSLPGYLWLSVFAPFLVTAAVLMVLLWQAQAEPRVTVAAPAATAAVGAALASFAAHGLFRT